MCLIQTLEHKHPNYLQGIETSDLLQLIKEVFLLSQSICFYKQVKALNAEAAVLLLIKNSQLEKNPILAVPDTLQ